MQYNFISPYLQHYAVRIWPSWTWEEQRSRRLQNNFQRRICKAETLLTSMSHSDRFQFCILAMSFHRRTVRGAGVLADRIPAKFGSFYAQSLLSARCKPCLAANLVNLWWNSRTSSTIHFPHCALLQGSTAPSFSNLAKSKFIHKWGTGQEQVGSEGEKYAKPLLVWRKPSAVA